MIGLLLAVIAPFAMALPCEDEVAPTTFEKINLIVSSSPIGYVRVQRSSKDFNVFWSEGWPYLKRRAAEADVSVHDLVAEQLELLDVIRSTNPNFKPDVLKSQRESSGKWLKSIERLEAIPLDKKMKAAQWEIVRSVGESLTTIALMAVHLEETYLEFPSVDPFGKIDAKYLSRVFDSLDHSSLDRAVKLAEMDRETREYRAMMKVLLKERAQLEELFARAMTEVQTTAAEEPETESAEEPIFELSNELAVVLRDGIPLEAGKIYHASTPRGENLTITLSENIVKEARNGEDKNIRRLLKSIFLGNGYRSGLKTLYEIGHGIIELKVIGNAHRRLIGCLEGRHVRLLSLKWMGDKGTQYFRQIPANLCK
ncbi:MAG: hypothetical protein AB7H97_19555 [Pseudobdellovibrionaceae bacterium]